MELCSQLRSDCGWVLMRGLGEFISGLFESVMMLSLSRLCIVAYYSPLLWCVGSLMSLMANTNLALLFVIEKGLFEIVMMLSWARLCIVAYYSPLLWCVGSLMSLMASTNLALLPVIEKEQREIETEGASSHTLFFAPCWSPVGLGPMAVRPGLGGAVFVLQY